MQRNILFLLLPVLAGLPGVWAALVVETLATARAHRPTRLLTKAHEQNVDVLPVVRGQPLFEFDARVLGCLCSGRRSRPAESPANTMYVSIHSKPFLLIPRHVHADVCHFRPNSCVNAQVNTPLV